MWRGRWFVLGAVVLALGLGALATRELTTVYTSRVAMTIGSPNRAPDQDAVLSVGYAQYFKDPAYQAKLTASQGIANGVRLDARTLAASPILYIEATAATPQAAQEAATKAGAAFRDEINARLRAGQDAAIAAVRKPFDDIRAANGVVNEVSLTQMQDRINQINGDTSNKLIDLQLASDAVRQSPSRTLTLVEYGAGGLVVGLLAVLGFGAASRRLRTADDIESKIGVPVIAVVQAEPATREQAMRQVVTAVGLAAAPERGAVAVLAPGATEAVTTVARSIAQGRARQGIATILVHADLHRPHGTGVGELLAAEVEIDSILTETRVPNLRELFAGSAEEDPFTAMSRERFDRLLSRLYDRADLVVIAAPPVLDAVEAQVITAAAGCTVLVLERSAARVGDARRTRRILEAVDAHLLGAVLVRARKQGKTVAAGSDGPDAGAV
ncbi:hypothetical protein D5S18_14320 [Nocardia panacis]|uniref:Polysaccharide chain length determinant N-terminal domain-containing protein n=1 Tax=Nocardia panacis TaxID=2340916 RepID=A0A3A4KRB4_9NOCA|nr:hypothetical protein [Nocardia panacis]RJO75600.1 hypothetical protein D5S18_14320 [Nocardia panacis]